MNKKLIETDPGKRTSDTRRVTGVRHGRRRRVLSRKWWCVRAWCGARARRAAAARRWRGALSGRPRHVCNSVATRTTGRAHKLSRLIYCT